MKTITVTASKEYDVLIGSGLLCSAGQLAASVTNPGKAAIISDSTVWPLYGKAVADSFCAAGFEICHYVFPAGEESKNGNTYLQILNFLAENDLTRSDTIIALGGGVVGDISGFAAATFLRGITCIQIPTTLLAMVDSSVGGKTAIDLPAGKNLAGCFYQPDLVLCDIDALNTLPADIFQDGCAEVIKYGVLYDPELFRHLTENGIHFDREYVISSCIGLKRDVVAEDEFDTGTRMRLNLGHTVGHGVEAQSNYTISHGKAVAIGMAIVTRAAAHLGFCGQQVCDDICSLIEQFDLPIATQFTAHQLYTSALSDKKRAGGTVNLIIPRQIGLCDIISTAVTDVESFIKAGL